MPVKRKSLKRILSLLSIVLFFVASAAVVFTHLYEEELKRFVIKKIDEKFSADIHADVIKMNLWKHFPSVALQFKNITITDSHRKDNPPVLQAKSLFLRFNIMDIIHKKYILRKVDIDRGALSFIIDNTGGNNFSLFRSEKSADDSTSFFFSIDDFSISNTSLHYLNKGSGQDIGLLLHRLNLPLKIRDKGLNIGLKGKLDLLSYRSEGVELFHDKALHINAAMDYNLSNEALYLMPSSFLFDDLPFDLTGDLVFSAKHPLLRIELRSKTIALSKLITLLPADVRKRVESLKSNGDINFLLRVNGPIGSTQMPKITADFSLNHGRLSQSANGVEVRELTLQGHFDNGSYHKLSSSSLVIKKFSGTMAGGSFSGSLSLKDMRHARLHGSVQAHFDLSELKALTSLSNPEKMEGSVSLKLHVSGKVNQLLQEPDYSGLKLDAVLNLKDAFVKLEGQDLEYQHINGELRFDNEQLVFRSLAFDLDDTKGRFSGTLSNYRSLRTNRGPLMLTGALKLNRISWQRLMKALDFGPSTGDTAPWKVNLSFETGAFQYQNIQASRVKGHFIYRPDEWEIQDFSLAVFNGKATGSLSFAALPESKKSLMELNGRMEHMNIPSLFTAFNNFDQEIITAQKISGNMDGLLQLSLPFDEAMNPLYASLRAQSSFKIFNGELRNVSELQALSRYTSIDDFSHISFDTLKNTVHIVRRRVLLPAMHIASDKMDMEVYGFHDFDNKYEYHFNVLLAEVLGRKVKKTEENEFGIIENDVDNRTRLFLTLSGRGSDMQVSYDRKQAAAQAGKNIKQEGQAIKEALKSDFVNARRDSLRKARKAEKEKQEQALKKQEQGEFIIEWDDEDSTGLKP